jgi:hypothetical protein
MQAGPAAGWSAPAATLPDLALLLPVSRGPLATTLDIPSGVSLPSTSPSG